MMTVYALAPERTRRSGEHVLDYFLPARHPVADEYEYPQYDDNASIRYKDVGELMSHLQSEPTSPYSLYWDSRTPQSDVQVEQGMLFFTEDGGMIVGLAVPENLAGQTLVNLRNVLGAAWGMATGDEPPPLSALGFIAACRSASLPRVVNGVFMDRSECC